MGFSFERSSVIYSMKNEVVKSSIALSEVLSKDEAGPSKNRADISGLNDSEMVSISAFVFLLENIDFASVK